MQGSISPNPQGFEWFCEIMQKYNFQKIGSKQVRKDFYRLGLEKRFRRLESVEVGFAYASPCSDYVVKVWITVRKDNGQLRKLGTDVGWVIVTQGDELIYCARYFLRSNKKFFLNIARYAWISKWKIDNIPLCPYENCRRQMEIRRKTNTRQYYYCCQNSDVHKKNQTLSWDYGLGPKAKNFLSIRRKKAASYNKKNKEAFEKTGKPIPVPKAKTRRVRRFGRPENIRK